MCSFGYVYTNRPGSLFPHPLKNWNLDTILEDRLAKREVEDKFILNHLQEHDTQYKTKGGIRLDAHTILRKDRKSETIVMSGDEQDDSKTSKQTRKRGRDDLFNQTFLSSRAGSLSLTNRIPFPTKLFQMLEDLEQAGQKSIASWSNDGRSFRVHDSKAFVVRVMPHYFRQSKYKSFQRQLHLYGFTRIADGSEKGSYFHATFLRSNRDLCKDMIPLKRGKRHGEQEDSHLEASSFSTKRSDDDVDSKQADNEPQGKMFARTKRAKGQEHKKDSRPPNMEGSTSEGRGVSSGMTTTITVAAGRRRSITTDDNQQQQHYHDRSPLMYFPPESRLLTSCEPQGETHALLLASGEPRPSKPSLLASQGIPDEEEDPQPVIHTSSHSSEEGKKTTEARTSDDQNNDVDEAIRVSLVPDPSNPTGMAALQNQYFLPLNRTVTASEAPRRSMEGTTPIEQPSSSSFVPQPSLLTLLPTMGHPSLLNHGGNSTYRHLAELQQQPRPRAAFSPCPIEQKQQDSPRPVVAAPLLSVLQQHQMRSSLLGEVYREQSHHGHPQEQQFVFQQSIMGDRGRSSMVPSPFLNQNPPASLYQQMPVSSGAGRLAANFPNGHPNNDFLTSGSMSATNMLLAFQQQMNDTFIQALINQQLPQQQQKQQQQQQEQYGVAISESSRAPRATPPPLSGNAMTTFQGGCTMANALSTSSNMLSLQTQQLDYPSRVEGTRPHEQQQNASMDNLAATAMATAPIALLNLNGPSFTSTYDSAPHVFSSSPFIFPTEQCRSPFNTSGLVGAPLMFSSLGMRENYHNQEQDEEQLSLPPPTTGQTASSMYDPNVNQQQPSSRGGEENSSFRRSDHGDNGKAQQQQEYNKNHSVAGNEQQTQQQQQQESEQQDVSPANSGNSFDSNLFEPNPFY